MIYRKYKTTSYYISTSFLNSITSKIGTVRVSCGHLCEAEAPTEAAAEKSPSTIIHHSLFIKKPGSYDKHSVTAPFYLSITTKTRKSFARAFSKARRFQRCGLPVATSAKQKHRPSRQARRAFGRVPQNAKSFILPKCAGG